MGHVNRIKLLAHRGHLLDKSHIVIALIISAGGKFGIHGVDFGLHLMQMGESLRCLLKHSASVFSHQMLRQIAYGAIARSRNRTTCGGTFAGQYFKQCAFAGTVLAHQGNAVFGIDDKRNIFEKGCTAELHGKSVN